MIGVAVDLGMTLTRWRTWWLMATQDIKLRYRRSLIGPFWLSIAMAVQIVGIGLLFSQIFDQPIDAFMLHVAAGLLMWALVSGLVIDGCTILVEAEGHLRALRIPTPVLAARMVSRNFLIFVHNIIIIGLLIVFLRQIGETDVGLNLSIITLVPGLALIALFGFFTAITLAPMCLRFRDVTQVITSLVGILFFVTPIIWMVDQGRVSPMIVNLNPLFHLIELGRAPLQGNWPTQINWMVSGGLVVGMMVASLVSLAVSRRRIYYWL